jgi:hypothetical protein
MRFRTLGLIALVVCLSMAGGAVRAEPGCKTVRGKILEVQVPSANDPFGRVLGNVTGALVGSKTAILNSLQPGTAPNTLEADTQDIFVTKDGDMLVTTGFAVFTFIGPGTVSDVLTLDVDGASSSGQFAGATGTIVVTGTGYNLGQGPGVTYFDLEYSGQICRP